MGLKIDLLSFESGIIDPLVEIRATAISHGKGARRLENMIGLPQGPAISRPPTRYVGRTKSDGAAVLFRVVYSELLAYEVEFGDGYCRFYTNDGQIQSGGSAYEIVSPYDSDDLPHLRAWNDAGTLYLVDGAHVPYRLVYSAETSWALEAIPFTWGPFRNLYNDLHASDILLAPDDVSGDVTLTATGGSPFVGGHVGAKILIGHRMQRSSTVHKFTAEATYGSFSVPLGAGWTIKTSGSGSWTLYVEKSYDGGSNWETAGTYATEDGDHYEDSGEESFDDAVFRLRTTDWVTGSVTVTFVVLEHIAYGYATITAVNSATEAEATVVEDLASTDGTKIFAFGSWCGAYGFPRGVGAVDNRLTLIGSTDEPTTQWLSRPNKYLEMRTDSTAASALTFTFTTGRGDPFLWILAEQNQYYIGTPSAILQIAAADPTSAISAENKPAIGRRIEFGSADLSPVRAQGGLVVVDGSGLRPMRIQYDWEQDLMFGSPMTFECPTITHPGIVKVVFQRGIVPMIWILRSDGWLVGVTYEQLWRQEILGPSEHFVGGDDAVIEDLDVLPSSEGDRIWLLVARTADGVTVRTIERMDTIDLEPTRALSHQLDSYVTYEGEDWADVEGLAVNGSTGVVTITITGHSFEEGDQIDLADLVGMDWLNRQILTVADVATDTFTLRTLAGVYVDGRLLGTYTSGGRVRQVENSFAGLDHLEGESVHVVADGVVLGPYTVTDGGILIDRYANRVAAGLFVDAWLQPLRLAIPLNDGSTRARQQNVTGLWISLYLSGECQYGPDADHLTRLSLTQGTTPAGTVPELTTGEFFVPVRGGMTTDPTILIHRHLPLPLCVRGLMLDTAMGGQKGGR